MDQRYIDSLLIILGDFNKANLSHELPKFRQHVTCPTRGFNILDHTTIKNAYHSVPCAALGLSDTCLVHLIPTFKQKLRSAKPVIRLIKQSGIYKPASFALIRVFLKLQPQVWMSSKIP